MWFENIVHDGSLFSSRRLYEIQLKAAVRDDPETAAEQLMAMGYSTQPPGGQS